MFRLHGFSHEKKQFHFTKVEHCGHSLRHVRLLVYNSLDVVHVTKWAMGGGVRASPVDKGFDVVHIELLAVGVCEEAVLVASRTPGCKLHTLACLRGACKRIAAMLF